MHMKDFDMLFNELNSFINKKELNIGELSYNNLIFRLTMEKNYYEKLNKGDIVIFNHQTKQYRTFKFVEKTNFHTKFECENLTLLIIPFISESVI